MGEKRSSKGEVDDRRFDSTYKRTYGCFYFSFCNPFNSCCNSSTGTFGWALYSYISYMGIYTNRGISFASYDTPISKCRGIIKSVEENYKVHILNEMKTLGNFDIDDLKKYTSKELFNVKLEDDE